MNIRPAQCRAARGLLDWTRQDLGRAARVSPQAVSDYERGLRVSHDRTVAALRNAFEAAGVIFIGGAEPGVQLKFETEEVRSGPNSAWRTA